MPEALLVCMAAGLIAGIGTGFAGLSAATVISPMLISFLGCPWYEAVGIGLASDVLASAVSAYIYKKHSNLDFKNGIYMIAAVLIMTIAGSYFSQYMPDRQMGYFSVFTTCFLGLRFLVWPATRNKALFPSQNPRKRAAMSVLCGLFIGFYCGFMGLGGGMMMLFILTSILGYDLKTAVGTSVFVMTFIALTGSVSHFYFGEMQPFLPFLALCVIFTLAGAIVTSSLSNRMNATTTNRVSGIALLLLGIIMLLELHFT